MGNEDEQYDLLHIIHFTAIKYGQVGAKLRLHKGFFFSDDLCESRAFLKESKNVRLEKIK